uniref:non-specific serine/threonine protein kinase n=1 Tax=Triticum urartu TaxID=4572 RepID=A0A8R7VC80_TRIUA
MEDASRVPRVLSFQLLQEITKNFSPDMKVGTGSYGSVYKGVHTNGERVAVKLLHNSHGPEDETFKKEYLNLANLQHKNIVRLVGYSHETRREFVSHNGNTVLFETPQRALCFEYMQNGSLDNFLTDNFKECDWRTHYAIIRGICQGMKYLHEQLETPMYHLDLKLANVLLDENMEPKIADFGLSRLFPGESQFTNCAIGTREYAPPEYIDDRIISTKFDIFSLGVVIIKIMAGPESYFQSGVTCPQKFIKNVHADWNNNLQTTPVYALEPYSKQVKRCIEVALSCVDPDRHKRPSIGEIINVLNETETAIQVPGASMNHTGSTLNKV